MHVIAVASQKGGSGKTTLAGHLAVAIDRAGAGPVALIDTDPQGSLSDWWNERQSESPLLARTAATCLSADLKRMQEIGINFVVVDTPPAIETTILEVVSQADLVLIPARPSPHDLRAAGATVALVERFGKRFIFVLNGATPRTRITNEAVMSLSQHGAVAPVVIHCRTVFAASMIDGRTVMEVADDGRSASEIMQLWNYLSLRLDCGDQRALPSETTDAVQGAA
jgi:chromosome partitioning protein